MLRVTDRRHVLWSGFRYHHSPLKYGLFPCPVPYISQFMSMLTKLSSAQLGVMAGDAGKPAEFCQGRSDSHIDTAKKRQPSPEKELEESELQH